MKFKDLPKNESSGGALPFLKLQNNETVTGILTGDIYDFHHIFAERKVVPPGTKGAAFRFRVNFVTKDAQGFVAKVWEQGAVVYNKLKDLDAIIRKMSKGQQDLSTTVVEITRRGMTKDDTEYEITIADQQPTEQTWKVIAKVPLNKLEHVQKAQSKPEPAFDAPLPEQEWAADEHPDIPF